MKILVFTAGFYDRDYDEKLRRLKASCKKFDIDLHIYGKGEFFSFFDSKIRKMGMFLDRFKHEYTHALFTDAADTFFLSSLEEIIEKYKSFNAPLVLSGEKSCYPYPDLESGFSDPGTSYKFFNAGGFIGQIDYLLAVISKLKSYYHVNNNDNAHWMLAYSNHKIDFAIDSNCHIFQTMSDVEFGKDVVIDESKHLKKTVRVYNKETQTYPCIIHFNGPKGTGTRNNKLMDEVFTKTW